MDTRFYCALRLRKEMAKCRHDLEGRCDTVRKVLKLNPDFGKVIPRYHGLRKMRVNVPELAIGKRGGYRLIYRNRTMDQTMHVVLLTVYFKGDDSDLNDMEYKELDEMAERILSKPMAFDWTDE